VAAIAVLSVTLIHANNQVTQLQGSSLSGAVSAALANPDHQSVALRSPGGQVLGTVVLVPGGPAYLTDVQLPTLGGDQTYQLWGITGTRAISLVLLGAHPHPAAFSLGSGTPAQLAVTIEPAGGSVLPSGAPVAHGVTT
jgi:hypothetical protein